jgi:cell division protein FtsL
MKKYWIVCFLLCLTAPVFAQSSNACRSEPAFGVIVKAVQDNLQEALKSLDKKANSDSAIYKQLDSFWNSKKSRSYQKDERRNGTYVYKVDNLRSLYNLLRRYSTTSLEKKPALKSIYDALYINKALFECNEEQDVSSGGKGNTPPAPLTSDGDTKQTTTPNNPAQAGGANVAGPRGDKDKPDEPKLPDFPYWAIGVGIVFILGIFNVTQIVMIRNEIKKMSKPIDEKNKQPKANEQSAKYLTADDLLPLNKKIEDLEKQVSGYQQALNQTKVMEPTTETKPTEHPQKVEEKVPYYEPQIHYAVANLDGNTLALKILQDDLDWAHFMIITSTTNPNQAEFRFGDKTSIERTMMRYQDIRYYCENLDSNCRVLPQYQSGVAMLQNGRWVVTQKIKIL